LKRLPEAICGKGQAAPDLDVFEDRVFLVIPELAIASRSVVRDRRRVGRFADGENAILDDLVQADARFLVGIDRRRSLKKKASSAVMKFFAVRNALTWSSVSDGSRRNDSLLPSVLLTMKTVWPPLIA
jgi:hypothetical protein